jgi:hypothetical protein
MVLRLLLVGNSVSSVERITDIHRGTILKLLVLTGEKCERIMATKTVNMKVDDVEADEVCRFIDKKEKRVRPADDQNLGDGHTGQQLRFFYCWYNFARVHKSLRCAPAMAAGSPITGGPCGICWRSHEAALSNQTASNRGPEQSGPFACKL